MDEVSDEFKARVYEVVRHIPRGKVMSYGQIAALVGSPRAARIVGGVAHWGDPDLPWQRVVMKDGSLASGYPGGVTGHQVALEAEGIEFTEDNRVNMSKHLWQPPHPNQNSLL
ncbi:MAG: MGMT family protein [Candidatus Saccharimonadales bacterium]